MIWLRGTHCLPDRTGKAGYSPGQVHVKTNGRGSNTCQTWQTAPPQGNDGVTAQPLRVPLCLNGGHSKSVAAK